METAALAAASALIFFQPPPVTATVSINDADNLVPLGTDIVVIVTGQGGTPPYSYQAQRVYWECGLLPRPIEHLSVPLAFPGQPQPQPNEFPLTILRAGAHELTGKVSDSAGQSGLDILYIDGVEPTNVTGDSATNQAVSTRVNYWEEVVKIHVRAEGD
ncbi:MAG: hypothetical protein AAF907_06795, partial [Planctomycetota bacterium]